MKNYLLITIFLFTLSACFKEEASRTAFTSELESIKIESDYSMQHYYNLNTNSIVSSNKWSSWNLKFYAQNDGYHVRLNDAANMKAYNTLSKNFQNINSLNNDWIAKVDNPEGEITALALDLNFEENNFSDTLFTNSNVYVLLLGSDAGGDEIGYKKVLIDYFYGNQYHIIFANLDGSEKHEAFISKDETVNYVSFSFENKGEIVPVEPDKNTWDILFSRSTDVAIKNDFSDTIFSYSVTGVLINQASSLGYQIKDSNYDTFSTSDLNNNNFTNQRNIIGFNWKAYDLNNSVYAIRQDNYYIIKDGNSLVYKLNFIGFIDPVTNERGTISFEYEVLK